VRIKSEYVKAELAKLGIVRKQNRTRISRASGFGDDPGKHLATLYVKQQRKENDRSATWFDVNDAYIAGFKAAEIVRAAQRRGVV